MQDHTEKSADKAVGYIDSVYCGSGVDGAGLRCVVFFSGCNLRCPFCHNPETLVKRGEQTDADALAARLLRYKPYFRRGGVTVSGGEPFLQKEFALALSARLKERGINVCFETNGHITDAELIASGDLIVDVKNQETNDVSVYEQFFEECVRQKKDIKITNVLVPGKNDDREKLCALASLVHRYFPKKSVYFLPFRKLCAQKYEELGIPFPYSDIREAEEDDVAAAKKYF